jgi:alkane 1-monooxygenase
MKSADLKYLIAYIIPSMILYGLWMGGIWIYLPLIITFLLIPILELMIPADTSNHDESIEASRSGNAFFDFLLYFNVLFVYAAVYIFAHQLSLNAYSNNELVGGVLSCGLILGTSGINVAHELGHRSNLRDQIAAGILLLPSHYIHFTIEHNFGHHKYVATPRDPATARKGENIFTFWIRSTFMSYINAWKIENRRIRTKYGYTFHPANRMIQAVIFHIIYNTQIWICFGSYAWTYVFIAGVVGFLLLETINYIEHYGLQRIQNPDGTWQKVSPEHSWNSDHVLGRILLYELTRHSDHHYKANRKYPNLRHMDESPQLPLGYPASLLMALVPPIWFWVMDKELGKVEGRR